MRKRTLSIALCLCMVLSLLPIPAVAVEQHPFTDVAASDWFNDSVQYVYEHGLMSGTTGTTFSPQRTTSRGMLVTILYRLENSPAVNSACPFPDVASGRVFEKPITWAASRGIVTGYASGNFGPDDNLTRQQMAAILYRYAESKGYDTSAQANLSEYTDSGKISNYAKTAMAWANANELINGTSAKALNPGGNATRAQAAAILMRFCENVVNAGTGTTDHTVEPPIVEPTSYSVTFDLNYTGGGTYQTLTVKEGGRVTEPANPSRNNYSFLGWYTSATSGVKFNFDSIITSVTTLYAQWRRNSSGSGGSGSSHSSQPAYFSVTFDSNGGSAVSRQNVQSGEMATKPSNPEKQDSTFVGWYIDSSLNIPYNFSSAVTSNITLYAKWEDSRPTTYKVSFNLNYDTATNSVSVQELNPGETITIPTDPERDGYIFAGWSTSTSYPEMFTAYDEGVDHDYMLYAYWVGNDELNDTDGDGLPDYLEVAYRTDRNNQDTDSDGLNDYQEIMQLETSPLLPDTDDDGTNDYNEDYDADGLENGYEYTIGTSPIVSDTDFDGLSDYAETNDYHTNPLNPDTDSDGASDGIEVFYGTNPLVADQSFVQQAESEPVSQSNAVAVSVVADVTGEQMGTVSVESVDTIDNPLVRSTMPGYLGNAYELTADGDIHSAVITFSYDEELKGDKENFEPRIYYLNSDNARWEELPNQTIENGKISASIEHFSTYILLDKIQVDEFWETEIKSPLTSGDDENATLSFVFVIDYSLSMDWNDPDQLCKELSKQFIEKLRDGKDQAAVVKFIKRATLASGLTTDKTALIEAIDGISYDNGHRTYSGTNGSAGLKMALDQLSSSDSEYKYVVFITDGEDTETSYSYDDLISDSTDMGITIFSVGMGTASEDTLKKVADATGGKYYHATTEVDTTDLIDMDSVFEDIQSETIDLTSDSNRDGIPDYYSRLIFEGKLGLSNGSYQFIGYNFDLDEKREEPSDDFDGDGIKNGDELVLQQNGDHVYLKMVSDPTLPDSDFDGIDDREEKVRGTDPLKYTYSPHSTVDGLTGDEQYADFQLADRYDNDFGLAIAVNLTDAFSFEWFPTKTCKQLYMDYLNDYGATAVQKAESENESHMIFEAINKTIDWVNELIQDGSTAQGLFLDEPAGKFQELYVYRSQLKTILKRRDAAVMAGGDQTQRLYKLADDYSSILKEINTNYPLTKNISIKVTDFAEKYQHFMNKKTFTGLSRGRTISIGVTALATGLDMWETFQTYSKINANTEAYAQTLDLFAYLSEYGNRDVARDAAGQIYDYLSGGYGDYLGQLAVAISQDAAAGVAGFSIAYAAEFLASKGVPYLAIITLGFDFFNLTMGLSHKAETIDNSLYLESITTAVRHLAKAQITEKSLGYDCRSDDHSMADWYLTTLAQLRIVGENNFVDYSKNKGWISRLFTGGYEEAKSFCKDSITKTRQYAKDLKLSLSSNLKDFDQ